MSDVKIKLIVSNEKSKIKLNTPDNLADLTKRAEEAAKSAEESAEYVQEVIENFEGGNLVASVEKENDNIKVTKANGEVNIIELPISFNVKILGDSEI